jgi:hypothetical protein
VVALGNARGADPDLIKSYHAMVIGWGGTMKRNMEVNGAANIKMLLQCKADKIQTSSGEEMFVLDKQTYDSILNECDLLVEYMTAYNKAIENGEQTPFWHDVKAAFNRKKLDRGSPR